MNKWDKLNKRLEEYDKLFGEQERKEYQERKELRESLDKLNPVSENGIWSEFAEEGLNE
tara:strand:+ start:326 stop:502 length:177 start_codon:yes stop_codon:yes gene_type:complete